MLYCKLSNITIIKKLISNCDVSFLHNQYNGTNMKKTILLSFLLSSVFSLQLQADLHYFSGQKEYLLKCRTCHAGSSKFVSNYSIKYWKELLDNDGIKLANIHKDIKDIEDPKDFKDKKITAEELKAYFKTPLYVKKIKYYEAFVEHFAKDGNSNK